MGLIIGAILIGLILGLLGSGGSILTLPILVYLLGHEDKIAVAESMAIVGLIAMFGAIPLAHARQVDWRSVLFFGVPGMLGTYVGAWLAKFLTGTMQLVLFAVIMLIAGVLMYRSGTRAIRHPGGVEGTPDGGSISGGSGGLHSIWKVVLEGLCVGVLTGIVGVGGGFLIVPALVLLSGLEMRVAVGTSLVVIALKSLTGFWKHVDELAKSGWFVDWSTIGWFAIIGCVGTLAGQFVGRRIRPRTLKRGFAILVVLMGAVILVRELPRLFVADRPAKSVSVESHGEQVQVLEFRDRIEEIADVA